LLVFYGSRCNCSVEFSVAQFFGTAAGQQLLQLLSAVLQEKIKSFQLAKIQAEALQSLFDLCSSVYSLFVKLLTVSFVSFVSLCWLSIHNQLNDDPRELNQDRLPRRIGTQTRH